MLQIATLIVFVSASTQKYSTLCPGPVGQYVVETLKETGQFDFSTPAAFDRAAAMFPCTLTWADSPGKKKEKQQEQEVKTLTLLCCCDSRVNPVMKRQTRFSCSVLQPEPKNNPTNLIKQHGKTESYYWASEEQFRDYK